MVSLGYLLGLQMKAFAAFTALTCLAPAASAATVPYDARSAPTLHQRNVELAAQLGPRLSVQASIYLAGSDIFNTLTERWQLFAPPSFIAAIEVYTERDIQYAVQFANQFGLPWLAISGHHGGISTIGNMKYGVQISMNKMDSLTLSPDGQTALIGGGKLSKAITDELWAKGKQTVTGACECTSLLGPMLGGGHGWLQGRYGLSADQLEEARVVLADGSLVTANANKNSDLFWALRGAGHNFGIVTQVKYKVHDVPANDRWTFASLIFTEDKTEKVFDLTNKLTNGGTQPVEFINFIWYMRIPTIDASKPIVNFYMLYQGSQQTAKKYSDQYAALGPVNTTIMETDYTQISALTGNGNEGIACQHGLYSALRFPTSLQSYDLPTQRKLMDKFADVTLKQPAFNNSFYLFEGYSLKGVKAVDPASTAFPDRFNNILSSPVIIYFGSEYDGQAVQAGQEIRDIALGAVKNKQLNAYVNYAHGDEQVEDWYGHESWRISKLKSLKQKFDPKNRLRFYAPIPAGGY
ncbi:MAG: hypothetical protein MMC23_005286 [Stictis urceolatum]|nr:hypothetical protein [Stictis urceolata]